MSGVAEVLDLVARWVHVIAAIMWVGNSLLFNWLDRSLVPASSPGHTKKPSGTIWLLHSGGFYYVEKTLLDGERLPVRIHWFMWQAYTTWISGIALLIIVYYAGGRAALEDPSVAALTHWQAIGVGIGAIVIGRALYELMQRAVAPKAPAVANAIWVTGLTAIAIALTQLLSGRAAFLHVGAMLGTIMAINVAETIVPSQRELVASVREGRGASAAVSDRAKRVSIHNNYLTFPVVVLMLSAHFPALYGHHLSWLVLLLIVAGGAGVRHILNLRWTWSPWKPALAATIGITVSALFAIVRLQPVEVRGQSAESGAPVTFGEARHVIDQRCAVCHSERPTDPSFGVAPGGVSFDTPLQIQTHAARIRERAFINRTMPPGNRTRITESERALLNQWAVQKAAKANSK